MKGHELTEVGADLLAKFNEAIEKARIYGKEEGEAISIPPGDAVADARGEYDQARYDFEDALRKFMKVADDALFEEKP